MLICIFNDSDIDEVIYRLACPYCGSYDRYSNVDNGEVLFCEKCGEYFVTGRD